MKKNNKKGSDEEIKLKEADQLCRRILHLAQKSNWESINEPLKVKIKLLIKSFYCCYIKTN